MAASSYVAALGIIGLAVAGIAIAGGGAARSGIATDGTYVYKQRPAGADGPLKGCVVCHSVEKGGALRVAPNLDGIVGAPKARARWYAYSFALRKAGGVWSEKDLDSFLAKPSAFLPGTSKTIVGIPDAAERTRIIAALKQRG